MLKPPLLDIELLDWQAFGASSIWRLQHTQAALASVEGIPRLPAVAPKTYGGGASLRAEIERRKAATAPAALPETPPAQ